MKVRINGETYDPKDKDLKKKILKVNKCPNKQK